MKCHYLIFTICCLIGVVGCAMESTRPRVQPVNKASQADKLMQAGQHKKAAKLYQGLAKSTPDHGNEYNLLALEGFIRSSDTHAAKSQIKLIDPAFLSIDQRNRFNLFVAQISLNNGNAEKAINTLERVNPQPLKQNDQIAYFQSLAFAYSLTGERLKSAQARVNLNPLLDDNQKQQNSQVIFNTLNVLSAETLNDEQTSATGDLEGWVVLTRILKTPRFRQNTDELRTYLNEWTDIYPKHPANSSFIKSYQEGMANIVALPATIALFLPESGRYAQAAQLIKEGFMAAFDQSQTGFSPYIRFYDTELASPDFLYQQAIDEGADLIVGPLSKKNIQTLTFDRELTVPVLALNHIPELVQDNLFQFGLSPIDEAMQITTKARLAGHKKMVLFTPETNQGDRIANHLFEYWQQPDDVLLESATYNPKNNDFSESIKGLLSLNESSNRFNKLKRLLNKDIQYTERRRQDIDGIFLSARSKNARSIYPQLRFYRATRVPVYATPEIYSGQPNPSLDRDLNNITFCDIPWLFPSIDSGELSKQALQSSWQSYPAKYVRLMALGIDSFNIISHLNQLNSHPYYGATGKLSINMENRITRQLVCAKFVKGKPVLQTPLYQENAIQDEPVDSNFNFFNL